ncbi:flagellin Hag [Shouchella lehensis]|uniref:Flagellin n=1 Tax=Shouchella lehensis TaxID=300825 RepID=A0A4Y7WEV5_9BACI|nr:flagellin Hag [Shouchella lehensis]MBG9785037.1 flagellin [Shouchella lehensis]TES46462.1 flagellin [Shouchella lehensis]
MIINNNLSAMNAHRQLGVNQGMAAKAQEKLSSGLRINRAGDDAAGLAISEKMRAQVRGLDQASRNAQDGISMIQTAEGALNETHSILQRMRELAVQSANDTATDEDRAEIQKEVDALAEEITRISNDTEFNNKKLLTGDFEGTFHIGANAGQNISLSIGAFDAETLGVGTNAVIDEDDADNNVAASGIDVSSQAAADEAITAIQTALDTVSSERSKLGANQNRLEHTINNLDNASENLSAAESRIRDVDMAKEIMEFTKQNILSQASQSMLAQANQQPQQVLQLLG